MAMDENGGMNSPLLGDITYEAPKPRETLPGGVDPRLANAETPVLDDFGAQDFSRPSPNAGGVDPRLANAVAPVLDDMGGAAAPAPKPTARYQELSDEQIAILQQQRAAAGRPPYTADEIAELKAEFIERQRFQAQQQALAAQAAAQQQANVVLEEATYNAAEKKPTHEILPEAKAEDLLEAPAPEPARRVSFNQDDIEAAKKNAAKRAADSLKDAPQTDPAEARRQLRELRQQQQADLANAGFPISIAMTVVGMISAFCMFLFSLRPYPEDFTPNGFFTFAGSFYKIVGIILMLLSLTIVLRVKQLKGLTSFLFIASSILLVIPGIVAMLYHKGADGFGLTVALYLIAIIGCFVVTFIISTSEKLNAYYGHKEIMYD